MDSNLMARRKPSPFPQLSAVGLIVAIISWFLYGFQPPEDAANAGTVDETPVASAPSTAPPPSTGTGPIVPQQPMVIYGQKVKKVWTGRCVAISDGDTVTVLTANNEQIKVRLSAIDCPESKQAYGAVAKQATGDMCHEQFVTVYETDKDRYGRVIGFIAANGIPVNDRLLQYGLAWHYRDYSNSPELQSMEDQARYTRVGLWADPQAIAPWEFRKR